MIWGIFLRCKEIGIKSWKIWNWNGITEKRALGFRVRMLDYTLHNKKRNIWDNSYNKKVYIERFWGRFFEYYVKQMVHWFDKYSTLNKSMSIRMYIYTMCFGKYDWYNNWVIVHFSTIFLLYFLLNKVLRIHTQIMISERLRKS